jgi:putative Mg2+ transporter-C (MgtC) family protein
MKQCTRLTSWHKKRSQSTTFIPSSSHVTAERDGYNQTIRTQYMDTITVPSGTGFILMRLGLAVLLGAAIGFNRELLRKPAGLQTHSLVALGAALVSLTSLQLTSLDGVQDTSAVSRAIQGLVAGVGFIGAGVIIHRGHPTAVIGLTTAASIWVVAAMGIAVGLGLWRTALVATGLSLGILIVGGAADQLIQKNLNAGGKKPEEDGEKRVA